VVLVALDHVAHPFDEGVHVARIAADLVVVGVRLDVCLVDDVEAVAIAEVEPVGIVRVVGRPHGVHVELLHEPRVGLHQLARDGPAADVVVVMAVHPADQHGLPVHEQASVAHFHATKPDPARDAFLARAAA
jgi:hypothetical protein